MKVCLYSPYVPKHFGGGEKFFFDVARTFLLLGHDVSVAVDEDLDEKLIQEKYENFLGVSLSNVHFIQSPFRHFRFWKKLQWTAKWDVLYYLTDGSLFFSLAKKNLLHIQVPFSDEKKGLINRLKLWNWRIKNTNSIFTKNIIERSWNTHVPYVQYPMIEAPTSVSSKVSKEKIILHVGRFFRSHHSKRQDVLVEIFIQMRREFPKETKDWQLCLVGAVEDEEYYQEVKKKALNHPIEFLQLSREELWKQYQRASIYWHATGFGLDPDVEPAKMEHFGISTVEAMSMGCVPVVIGLGGQIEVVGDELHDLLWKTAEECIAKTLPLLGDVALRQSKAEIASRQAKKFDAVRFRTILEKMVK